MKVRVIQRPPIEKRHGVEVGNVYERIDTPEGQKDGMWIMGADGEPVKLLPVEYVRIKRFRVLVEAVVRAPVVIEAADEDDAMEQVRRANADEVYGYGVSPDDVVDAVGSHSHQDFQSFKPIEAQRFVDGEGE